MTCHLVIRNRIDRDRIVPLAKQRSNQESQPEDGFATHNAGDPVSDEHTEGGRRGDDLRRKIHLRAFRDEERIETNRNERRKREM